MARLSTLTSTSSSACVSSLPTLSRPQVAVVPQQLTLDPHIPQSDALGMDTASLSIKDDDGSYRVDVPMRSINGGPSARLLVSHSVLPSLTLFAPRQARTVASTRCTAASTCPSSSPTSPTRSRASLVPLPPPLRRPTSTSSRPHRRPSHRHLHPSTASTPRRARRRPSTTSRPTLARARPPGNAQCPPGPARRRPSCTRAPRACASRQHRFRRT